MRKKQVIFVSIIALLVITLSASLIAKKGNDKTTVATRNIAIATAGSDATTSSPIYYTPAPMSVILKRSLPGITLSALSTVSNRTKFMIGDNSSGALSKLFDN